MKRPTGIQVGVTRATTINYFAYLRMGHVDPIANVDSLANVRNHWLMVDAPKRGLGLDRRSGTAGNPRRRLRRRITVAAALGAVGFVCWRWPNQIFGKVPLGELDLAAVSDVAGVVGAVAGVLALVFAAQQVRLAKQLSSTTNETRHSAADVITGALEASAPSTKAWPHRIGIIPPLADCRQERPVDRSLAELSRSGSQQVVVCQVLSGMGGVGKTQLAAAFAHRMWRDGCVDLLVWLTADSRESIIIGYADVAKEVTGVTDEDPERAARRLLVWLSESDRVRWLIVLDDLQNPGDLGGLWPPVAASGLTVVTTRRRDAALTGGRKLVEVGLFTAAESLAYMSDRLGEDTERLVEAAELVEDLGHLPLALAQCAAYLLDRDLTCAEYRQRFRDRRRLLSDLNPEPGALPDEHRQTIATTWSLSIEHADALKPIGFARPALELAALLDPNAVPEALFSSGAVMTYLGDRLEAPSSIHADDAHDALSLLHRLNLITFNRASHTIRIHAVLQRAIRESTAREDRAGLAEVTGNALVEIWPDVENSGSSVGQMLRANVAALRAAAEEMLWTRHAGMHHVLFKAGTSLGEAGLVTPATDYYRSLAETARRLLGSDHSHTLTARHGLVRWQGEAGDPAGAAASARVLLADRIRVQGTDHPDTLLTRGSVARWEGEAGDAAGAAAATRTLLVDRLRIQGPNHIDTLTTRHNLAYWQGESGDFAGAAAAFKDLLADMIHVLGPDHPDTLTTRNDLAWWRGKAGDPAAAASELQILLPDRQRVLGEDHPHALITRNDLAWWQGLAGDAAGAARAFENLLTDMVRVLGPEHPRTLTTRHNLAWWHGEADDAARAVTEFSDLLSERERILGPLHPHTMITRGSLAHWQGRAGDPTTAIAALEALLADRLHVLGESHPHTETARNHLRYWQQRQANPATKSATQALYTDIVKVLGPDHPDTLTIWAADFLSYKPEPARPGSDLDLQGPPRGPDDAER